MKFINKALLFLALLSDSYYQVNSHGVEVRYCQTNANKLRILIEHWHGDLSSASEAGTMDLIDPAGDTIELAPDGHINNQSSTSIGQAADCVDGTSFESSTCSDPYQDWVYYDFPNDCGLASPPEYTLVLGNTVYLREGCTNLYPTTISLALACTVVTTSPSVSPSMVEPVPTGSSWVDDAQCKNKKVKAGKDTCVDLGGRCKLNCKEDEDFDCIPGLCSYDKKWDKVGKGKQSRKMHELMEDKKTEVVEIEVSAVGNAERKLKSDKSSKSSKSTCACKVPKK